MGGVAFSNAPLRTTQSYAMQVSRGDIGGSVPLVAYGRHIAVGAVTNNIVWPNGIFIFPNQVTGESITLVSTSIQDATGLTGVQSVQIHYLDINLDPHVVDIPLTGTTPVVSVLTGVRFIQQFHARTLGNNTTAVGTITAYRTGSPATVFSIILPNKVRAGSSARMVPRGKRAVLLGVVGSSISGTAAARADIELVATELDTVQYIDPFVFFPQASIGVQDGGLTYTFPLPAIYKAGTIIAMRVTLDKGASISADWFSWLEDDPTQTPGA